MNRKEGVLILVTLVFMAIGMAITFVIGCEYGKQQCEQQRPQRIMSADSTCIFEIDYTIKK